MELPPASVSGIFRARGSWRSGRCRSPQRPPQRPPGRSRRRGNQPLRPTFDVLNRRYPVLSRKRGDGHGQHEHEAQQQRQSFFHFVCPSLLTSDGEAKHRTGRAASSQRCHNDVTFSRLWLYCTSSNGLRHKSVCEKSNKFFFEHFTAFFRVFCLLNRIFAPRLGLLARFFAFFAVLFPLLHI